MRCLFCAPTTGEGGIVALLALLSARNARPGTFGLVGAAALEGLKVDAPSLAPAVVLLTVIILIGLFVMQRKGSGFIGNIFGLWAGHLLPPRRRAREASGDVVGDGSNLRIGMRGCAGQCFAIASLIQTIPKPFGMIT